MQRQLLFSAVTFILLGHIFSSPINHGSGDQLSPVYPNRELQVDRSNLVLGDVPIVPDHEDIEILNTRRKFLQHPHTCMHLYDVAPILRPLRPFRYSAAKL